MHRILNLGSCPVGGFFVVVFLGHEANEKIISGINSNQVGDYDKFV